jgi:hypothetical protein
MSQKGRVRAVTYLICLVAFSAQLVLPKLDDLLIGPLFVDPVAAIAIGVLCSKFKVPWAAAEAWVILVTAQNIANYMSYPSTWPRSTIPEGDLEWFGLYSMLGSAAISAVAMLTVYLVSVSLMRKSGTITNGMK